MPLERDSLALPTFDIQFPSNMVAAYLPALRLRILGLRVPMYLGESLPNLLKAWQWIESAAAQLRGAPAVILGDLNIPPSPGHRGRGAIFHRILERGWHRATPTGYSYLGHSGRCSEIDHILATSHCTLRDARYVTSISTSEEDFTLSGSSDVLSDHVALVAHLDIDACRGTSASEIIAGGLAQGDSSG
jgi:hypothetical protein